MTSTVMIRVDTLDRFSYQHRAVGYALLAIFMDPSGNQVQSSTHRRLNKLHFLFCVPLSLSKESKHLIAPDVPLFENILFPNLPKEITLKPSLCVLCNPWLPRLMSRFFTCLRE